MSYFQFLLSQEERHLDTILNDIVVYTYQGDDKDSKVIGRYESYIDDLYESMYSLSRGTIILFTCLRMEIYLDTPSKSQVEKELERFFGDVWRQFKVLEGVEAVKHIFEVACGLQSRIVGENEILGQVRNAWLKSRERGYISEYLDMIFHRAIIAGRRARNETNISRGVIGYPQAAIELLSNLLGDLNNKSILIIGAGQASSSAIEYLTEKYSPKKIYIANRSVEKAERLTKENPVASVARLEDIPEIISEVDGVFSAISGGRKLLDYDIISSLKGVVVDISNPSIAVKVPGKTYTFEDVKRLAEESINNRMKEVGKVYNIIEEEMRNLSRDVKEAFVKPLIDDIMKRASKLIDKELDRHMKYIDSGEFDISPILRVSLNSYMKKVFRPLLMYLREKGIHGDVDIVKEIHSIYMKELKVDDDD